MDSGNTDDGSESIVKLLSAAVTGDHDALSKLLLNFAFDLRRYCASLIDTKWQSLLSEDDILQESYAEMFLSVSDFRGQTPNAFFNWSKKICRHNYLDAVNGLSALKRGGGKVRQLGKDDSMRELFEVVCTDDSPRLKISKQESIKKLASAIQDLPQDYADVILAIEIECRPIAEFAREHACSEGAVYMRRSRAIRALRQVLGSSVDF